MLNRRHRLRAVAALGDDLHVLFLLQQRQDALARNRLVVDDQRTYFVHATLSIADPDDDESEDASGRSISDANGITIVTASPTPDGARTSKR